MEGIEHNVKRVLQFMTHCEKLKENTGKRHLSCWKKKTLQRPRSRLAVIQWVDVRGEHSQYLPGVLEATQWTVSSPVSGLDSTLRSVGGDRPVRRGKQTTTQAWETWFDVAVTSYTNSRQMNSKIHTSDNVAGDGVSTVASIEDGLNAVCVLSSRNQVRNIYTSSVWGRFSGRLAYLAGEHRKLSRRRQTCRCQKPRKNT